MSLPFVSPHVRWVLYLASVSALQGQPCQRFLRAGYCAFGCVARGASVISLHNVACGQPGTLWPGIRGLDLWHPDPLLWPLRIPYRSLKGTLNRGSLHPIPSLSEAFARSHGALRLPSTSAGVRFV